MLIYLLKVTEIKNHLFFNNPYDFYISKLFQNFQHQSIGLNYIKPVILLFFRDFALNRVKIVNFWTHNFVNYQIIQFEKITMIVLDNFLKIMYFRKGHLFSVGFQEFKNVNPNEKSLFHTIFGLFSLRGSNHNGERIGEK